MVRSAVSQSTRTALVTSCRGSRSAQYRRGEEQRRALTTAAAGRHSTRRFLVWVLSSLPARTRRARRAAPIARAADELAIAPVNPPMSPARHPRREAPACLPRREARQQDGAPRRRLGDRCRPWARRGGGKSGLGSQARARVAPWSPWRSRRARRRAAQRAGQRRGTNRGSARPRDHGPQCEGDEQVGRFQALHLGRRIGAQLVQSLHRRH